MSSLLDKWSGLLVYLLVLPAAAHVRSARAQEAHGRPLIPSDSFTIARYVACMACNRFTTTTTTTPGDRGLGLAG